MRFTKCKSGVFALSSAVSWPSSLERFGTYITKQHRIKLFRIPNKFHRYSQPVLPAKCHPRNDNTKYSEQDETTIIRMVIQSQQNPRTRLGFQSNCSDRQLQDSIRGNSGRLRHGPRFAQFKSEGLAYIRLFTIDNCDVGSNSQSKSNLRMLPEIKLSFNKNSRLLTAFHSNKVANSRHS